MIKRTTFLECVGFDSESFPLIFWDSDFCLRMRKRGYENIYTSFARGKWQRIEPEKVLDAQAEQQEKNLFQKRWYKELCAGDPYYNRV